MDGTRKCKHLFPLWSSRGGSGAGSLGGAQQLTGGGVVAENFRDLQKPSRFSGGGGGGG